MKKFLTVLLVICMILSQGVVSFANIKEHREIECNDTRSDAHLILTSYGDEHTIYGTVNPYDRNDWFKLFLKDYGHLKIVVRIDDHNASPDLDIDVFIRDENNNLIQHKNGVTGAFYFDPIEITSIKEHIYINIDHDSGHLKEPYSIEVYHTR